MGAHLTRTGRKGNVLSHLYRRRPGSPSTTGSIQAAQNQVRWASSSRRRPWGSTAKYLYQAYPWTRHRASGRPAGRMMGDGGSREARSRFWSHSSSERLRGSDRDIKLVSIRPTSYRTGLHMICHRPASRLVVIVFSGNASVMSLSCTTPCSR